MADQDFENPLVDAIVREAEKRFKRCQDWEADARKLQAEDTKFVNADSDNGWQWPSKMKQNRDLEERPSLTINKTRQHCLQIINDAKQNKPGIAVRPVGDGASYAAAQIWAGVIRHIEYQSCASVAYDIATEHQVQGGIGYWRLLTDYVDEETFDQEIFIREIHDPLKVYLDPDIQMKDGSDARFAFVFTDLDRDRFLELYPEYKDKELPRSTLGSDPEDIGDDDQHKQIRVAEYWRKIEVADTLVYHLGPDGNYTTIKASELPAGLYGKLKDDPDVKLRPVTRHEIEFYEIIGDQRKPKQSWPGRYIPIVRLVGEETVIDGKLDRKGHVRALKDPQRMYNYWTSAAVEQVALQGKTPWVAPAEAIEGFETYWESANTVNHAVLPYNAYNDTAQQMPPPQRAQPPVMAQAYIAGMQIAGQEMSMVSGQYDAQMGNNGNERTGLAINERQRQGDNATYHYIDNLAIAIRYTGKILLDLIPRIYDTKRIIQILAEDGTNIALTIDPQARQVLAQKADRDGKIVETVLNPTLGKFEVEADIGPGYSTKREQAFDSMVTLLTQNPQMGSVIGDLMLRAADFPMADEAAERLKRMVPAQALGQGPTANEQAMQQQLQALTAEYQKLQRENAIYKIQLKSKEEMRDIDAYDAITKRLGLVVQQGEAQQDMRALVMEVVQDALKGLGPVFDQNAEAVATNGLSNAAPLMQQQTPAEQPQQQQPVINNPYEGATP